MHIITDRQTVYKKMIFFSRFGTSKYTPPDRSEEIRPMQELLKEKQKAEEDADAASKGTVIKVLMGEVQVNNLKKLLIE